MPDVRSTEPSHGTIPNRRTSWTAVSLAITAGALAAFQVGKVHIGLTSIRESFSLGLVSASWILSALNIVGLFAAIPAGSLSGRMGNKRAVVLGLVLIAVSSALGSFSPSFAWLLLSRFTEGIGFVLIVVAAPSLIVEVTNPGKIAVALAGWSAYMPGGIALISILAPMVLEHHTWRALWRLNAGLLLFVSVIIVFLAKGGTPGVDRPHLLRPWDEFRAVLSARGPVLLAIIFGLFTLQHLSVMGLMPTLLHEHFRLPEAEIGVLVSFAMASNIAGNLAAGVLLQRGFSRARIIAAASLFMACMTVGIFLLHFPLIGFYTCSFAFSCVGGLVPSAVMSAVPFETPTPSLLAATNGLLVQGSNLGIVFGPPMMSTIAMRLGWQWVPAMTGIAAVLAAVLAGKLKTTAHPNPNLFTAHVTE